MFDPRCDGRHHVRSQIAGLYIPEILGHDNVVQALAIHAFKGVFGRHKSDVGGGLFIANISPLADAGNVVQGLDDLRIGFFNECAIRCIKRIPEKMAVGNRFRWKMASRGNYD